MSEYIDVIFSESSYLLIIWTLGVSLTCFLVGYFISLLISLFNKIIR